jgi:hypothetical protein
MYGLDLRREEGQPKVKNKDLTPFLRRGMLPPRALQAPHEALSVLSFPDGLLSVDSTRRCRVLGHPGEPFPERTHESSESMWGQIFILDNGYRIKITREGNMYGLDLLREEGQPKVKNKDLTPLLTAVPP